MFEEEYRYDTQLLLESDVQLEAQITQYIEQNFEGDCLLVIQDESITKIHFHTNTPWEILEYCATLGEIFDIVIEDMVRQSKGLKG